MIHRCAARRPAHGRTARSRHGRSRRASRALDGRRRPQHRLSPRLAARAAAAGRLPARRRRRGLRRCRAARHGDRHGRRARRSGVPGPGDAGSRRCCPRVQSLREVLGDDYARVAERARSAGLDLAMLDRFAPWFVAVTLMQLELANRGFTRGARRRADAHAPRGRRPQTDLGTRDGGAAVRRIRRAVVAAAETHAADDAGGNGAARHRDRQAARRLARRATSSRWRRPCPRSTRSSRSSTARSPRIATGPGSPQLVDLLDDEDDYLVVVGALHLVGRNSVVDLLEQRGYDVEQQ